jgi:hypothetical protein
MDAYRVEAAGGANRSDGLLSGYRSAYRTIGQGHRAIHGGTVEISKETGRAASLTNEIQSAGTTADHISDGDQDRPPVELPL